MSNNKFFKEISSLSARIDGGETTFELYYERGYYYFLANEDELAKADYIKAVSYGLDFTECPYYSFSSSNEKRREFLLPEKILVFLILIVVIITFLGQIYDTVLRFKGLL